MIIIRPVNGPSEGNEDGELSRQFHVRIWQIFELAPGH